MALLEAGGTLVVPSRQRAHAARLAYAAAQLAEGRKVWASADILPLEAWQARELERAAAAGAPLPRLISPAEEWLLWRQCAAEATSTLELLDPAGLADALRRASGLAAEFELDVARLASAPGLEAPLLFKVQRAVDERCRSLGAARVHTLIGQLPGRQADRAVNFDGFLKLPPRLVSAGATLSARRGAVAHPRVAIATDENDELERIALWCQGRIAERPGTRLLVICPGSPGTRERLATLIRQTVDAKAWLEAAAVSPADAAVASLAVLEGGSALARIPIVTHALHTLEWLAGAPAQFSDVSEWMRDPYWNTPEEAARARIDLWLRKRGLASVSLRHWRSTLSGMPAELLESARAIAGQLELADRALTDTRASPREWSERFRTALEAMSWPGARTRGSAEQQTVVRFYELLDEFGQLALSVRSMSQQEAVRWLTDLAARTSYRPADEDAIVTISPALADPVVLYDGIWVAGLHADALPQPVQPDPFLPLAMQTHRGIPQASSGGRLEEAHALMDAWRSAADELVLSVPARSGDLQLLPSPMLALWRSPSEPAAREHGPLWLAARLQRAGQLESVEDPGVAWPVERSLPGGTRSLDLQSLCAFRAYAELRLGSQDMETPEPGVGFDVRGNLLHSALQKLWHRLSDSRGLTERSESALGELIEQSVAEAAEVLLALRNPLATSGVRERLFARECRRAVRLITQLCALERERRPFRVVAMEADATLTLAGARVPLRIDRLDELEDGRHAILDYKTGRRKPADWYSERPSHPQLLAYLAAHRTTAAAMAMVSITAREIRFDGLADSAQRLPRVKPVEAAGLARREAWAVRTQEWLSTLERLARDFLAGRAALDPKPGACDYCHAIGICRISERALERLSEAAELTFEPVDV